MWSNILPQYTMGCGKLVEKTCNCTMMCFQQNLLCIWVGMYWTLRVVVAENNICVYWSIPRHMYKKRTPSNRSAIVHINLHNIVNTHKCIHQFTIFHSYVTQVFCSKLICPLPPTTIMHKRISYVICLIGDFPMQNSRWWCLTSGTPSRGAVWEKKLLLSHSVLICHVSMNRLDSYEKETESLVF
jgi:hypothetical protein